MVASPPGAPEVVDKGFAGACWHGRKLFACMPNCVMVFTRTNEPDQLPFWRHIQTIHDCLFNDLHHVCSMSDGVAVANTGLETIDCFDEDGTCTARLSLRLPEDVQVSLDEARTASDEQDFRRVSTRNRHVHHLNHVFDSGDGGLLATLLKSRKIVRLIKIGAGGELIHVDASHVVTTFSTPPHEGFVCVNSHVGHGEPLLWASTVDGSVFARSMVNGEVVRQWSLGQRAGEAQGWTRGLCILPDGFLVGATAIREHNRSFLPEGMWPWRLEETCTAVTFVPFDLDAPSVMISLPDLARRPKIFSILPFPTA